MRLVLGKHSILISGMLVFVHFGKLNNWLRARILRIYWEIMGTVMASNLGLTQNFE